MRKRLLSILHFSSCLKVSTISGGMKVICEIKGKSYVLRMGEEMLLGSLMASVTCELTASRLLMT